MDKLKSTALFLLDMDGTLYLGDEIIEGATDFVRAISHSGRKYIYLTNNSSRSCGDYVARLRGLGFPCRAEDVFTSGMATAMYITEKLPGAGVYPVGTGAFSRELAEHGVRLTQDDPDAVVVGFDRELTYEKLERAVHFLRRGARFIASNPDLVCPMPGGEALPDCGSICALLTAATGKSPLYIGKPHRRMADIISARNGVSNASLCVVGDRLYTDMAMAINAGAVSVCVLSGETTREMLEASPYKPDYIFPSIAELAAALI